MEERVHPCTSLITLLFLLLLSHTVSARLHPTYPGSSLVIQEEDIAELMGLEKCEEGDKACVQERILGEAHLDYIYTQNHNPKGSPP